MSYKLLLYRDESYPDSHIADRYPAPLKEMLPDVEVVLARTRAEADLHIASADAVFGNLPPDLFARGKRLRWIQCPQAGPDPSFYHPALAKSDVVVTNMRGIFNDHISAHILAMVLAFARGLPRYWAQQARRDWTSGAPTFYLPECTAVILGVGGIGAETARLCAEFAMRVIGVDPRLASPPPGVAELVPPERMNDTLPRGDFGIGRLLTAENCTSNNGTKSTPGLCADILGDWREEVIWRSTANNELRIYTTTTVATNRLYTLMHDPQYRCAIAWQNTAYNQPPHPSFYLGEGMKTPPRPNIELIVPKN
jgi:hypothetical protein